MADVPPRHQRIVIGLSVRILRGAMTRADSAKVDGVEVRLALRCLLAHCPERWPLEPFWDAAGQDNEIGCAQGTTAAFKGIVRQLRAAGRYEDAPPRRGVHRDERSGRRSRSYRPHPSDD